MLAAALPGAASADLPSLKESCRRADALDDRVSNAVQIPYRFCDDGIPRVGGTTPNEGAVRAIRVPQRYRSYEGLPRRTTPDPESGADSEGFIALDVNVSLPDARRHRRPRNGYPLIVLMHGCCPGSKDDWRGTVDSEGDRWHYTDAWFAARGYVVLSYTSRGFVDERGRGSTGQTQLNHRSYEGNDLQYLAGLLAEDPFFGVNPNRIVVTGNSYGGALAWMALTDPTWDSPRRKIHMKLAAVAPEYGWTDLLHSLVPNGRYLQDQVAPTPPAEAVSRTPFGSPKRSFISTLFPPRTPGDGRAGPTFPTQVSETFACLSSNTAYEVNPLCANVAAVVDSFVTDRSAYLQTHFFSRMANDSEARVPVFSAGSFSDQLFPMEEHRRMESVLRSLDPSYRIQEYYGDYGHATQHKAHEWADLCDGNHHPCRADEYRRGFNRAPADIYRLGVTTRLNRFIDYYARPPGNPKQSRPRFDVTVALQNCSQNAGGLFPLEQPGQRFNAARIGDLAPNGLELAFPQERTTTYQPNDPHAAATDPVANTCPSPSGTAGSGVATYTSNALAGDVTMIGQTRVATTVAGSGTEIQLNARLYDVFPGGRQVLVDRGVHKLTQTPGVAAFDLHGNAWRFREGHRIRIELTQDDDPYVRRSVQPSALTLRDTQLSVPIREIAPGEPGESGPTLRVSVGRRPGGEFTVTARSATGERTGIATYELWVDAGGYVEQLQGEADSPYRNYAGAPDQTYTFFARATDFRGVPGPVASTTAVGRP